MNIQYISKYDLYEHGNYIGAFDSKEELNTFFEKTANNLQWRYPSEEKRIEELNRRCFSIIQSKHLNFS